MSRLWRALPFLLASTLVTAETYRWLDEQGNVHFSDKLPLNQQVEDISDQLEQSNVDLGASAAMKQLQHRQNARSARQVEQQQKNQLQLPHEQRRTKACLEARRELSVLQGRVIFFDDQGNEIKVTEKEREKRADEFEKLVKKNCS